MTAPLLEVSGLEKRFGGVRALNGVDMAVNAGEIVGLIGPNGAGKTTLFNVISGIERPSAGAVRFDAERIDCLRTDEICHRGIARTFQHTSVLHGMTVFENVYVAALFTGPRGGKTVSSRGRAEKALALCDLAYRVEDLPEQLTIAEQKRLELARAVATEPRLIMTDEVMAGLNRPETDEVLSILRQINQTGIAVLFVEHDVRAVMQLCQRLVVLAEGRVLAAGDPREVASSVRVIGAYLGSRYATR